MTGALIILAVTIAVGVLLWAWEKARAPRHGNTLHHHAQAADSTHDDGAGESQPAVDSPRPPAICCGLHAICEKTGQVNEVIYYDDEELDRFAGKPADEYTDAEIEEFRDVLLTLLPSDAPGWSVSLQRRRIALPEPLMPELELLLSEAIL